MFTIMLVLLFRPVGAQTEDAFPSYIEQCFNNYFNFNPQEKIYLHTDKPTYSAGGVVDGIVKLPQKQESVCFIWIRFKIES